MLFRSGLALFLTSFVMAPVFQRAYETAYVPYRSGEIGVEQAGGRALAVQADTADEADVLRLFETVDREFGAVTGLVNNAGITQPVKFLDITGGDYDRILDVSLRGTLYASQAVIPSMIAQNSGSIVCISSVSAQRGGGILGGPHYSAAKAGVLGLARAMAREYGGNNIRVNCVTPGLIATDIIKGKDRKSTRLNSSHMSESRMPSSA